MELTIVKGMPIPERLDQRNKRQLDSCVAIAECGEPLRSITGLSPRIQSYPYYRKLGFKAALTDCYVREGVAKRLVEAAGLLPEGYSLVIWDGWRPYELQQELYDRYRDVLIGQGWTDGEALRQEVTKFVALPSVNPDQPAPHLTGGAVDLTIAGPDGWLDMGTEFDEFCPKARTRYFESLKNPTPAEAAVRENRRLLFHVMREAGFTNYQEEWWHFDYGNPRWAAQKNAQPIYKGILTMEE
ncbi:M15 family metallopeptidase [Brevibacillus fluminis]|uniref:M15 family metallopeptidase n=1 Tax=Brevibacillus fluminis TaxID=511487 RepID=UPI003F886019